MNPASEVPTLTSVVATQPLYAAPTGFNLMASLFRITVHHEETGSETLWEGERGVQEVAEHMEGR